MNNQAAARQFAAVPGRDPDFAPTHINLARVFLELGDKGVLEHVQTAVMPGGKRRDIFHTSVDTISADRIKTGKLF